MINQLTPIFVEFMPVEKHAGNLYISWTYEIAIHLCACGCGNEVITPLHGNGWKITSDDGIVTLHPSIGNWQFACRSHYWIRENKIVWA